MTMQELKHEIFNELEGPKFNQNVIIRINDVKLEGDDTCLKFLHSIQSFGFRFLIQWEEGTELTIDYLGCNCPYNHDAENFLNNCIEIEQLVDFKLLYDAVKETDIYKTMQSQMKLMCAKMDEFESKYQTSLWKE